MLRQFATSALDVSDGLVGDLAHICEVSEVGASIDLESIPLSKGARALLATDQTALSTILTGGDDYEVLATVPVRKAAAYTAAAASVGVSVTRIGEISRGRGAPVVLDRDGRRIELAGLSFDHFRSG